MKTIKSRRVDFFQAVGEGGERRMRFLARVGGGGEISNGGFVFSPMQRRGGRWLTLRAVRERLLQAAGFELFPTDENENFRMTAWMVCAYSLVGIDYIFVGS